MKYKESETVEFKKTTSELKEAVISVSAILNKHSRGEVYFGIKNDGSVIGQDVGSKTLRDISHAISENIEPKIYPKIRQIKINNKTCIKVSFEGKDAPYFAYGRAYMRVADEDRQISARELEHLIINKNKDKLRWDNEICPQARISNISMRKLKTFLKIAGLKYDMPFNSLAKLKLLSGRKLLNTAVILFAKKPQDFFPNAKLRCAVFATTDTALPADMQDFEGDLFYLIKQAEEYFIRNIHMGMRLEGFYRVDVPEIDKEAFREAVINAFCHRDYRAYDSVNVAIFKDRVEVRSPGLLFGGLTISRIRREMVSERRNELIAELFHRAHFIERWGRGINLILSKEPKTIFKEVGTHFITVFKRKNVDEIASSTPQKGVEEGVENLSANEGIIYRLIKNNPSISKREITINGRMSKKTVDYNINKLKQKGILRRIGPDKGGYWQVKF